jgi:hypothetical protein
MAAPKEEGSLGIKVEERTVFTKTKKNCLLNYFKETSA